MTPASTSTPTSTYQYKFQCINGTTACMHRRTALPLTCHRLHRHQSMTNKIAAVTATSINHHQPLKLSTTPISCPPTATLLCVCCHGSCKDPIHKRIHQQAAAEIDGKQSADGSWMHSECVTCVRVRLLHAELRLAFYDRHTLSHMHTQQALKPLSTTRKPPISVCIHQLPAAHTQ